MLVAFRTADDEPAASQPGCHLPWTLLAGIGRIESGHAGGGRVDGNGTYDRAVGPMQFLPTTPPPASTTPPVTTTPSPTPTP